MSRIIIHRGHNQIVMFAYLYKRTSFFRLTLVLLFLTCTLTSLGQQQDDKDFRTELDLPGNFPAFALAPDGNCWLLSGNNGHITLRTSSRTGTAPHHSTLPIIAHGQTYGKTLTIFPFSILLPPLRLHTTTGVNGAITTSLKTRAKVGHNIQWGKNSH